VLDLKLKKLPEWIGKRRQLAAIYDEALADLPQVKRPPGPDHSPYFDIFQNYVIEAERRDELARHLTERKIETMVSWPKPMHHQPIGLDHFTLPRTRGALRPRHLAAAHHRARPGADPHGWR